MGADRDELTSEETMFPFIVSGAWPAAGEGWPCMKMLHRYVGGLVKHIVRFRSCPYEFGSTAGISCRAIREAEDLITVFHLMPPDAHTPGTPTKDCSQTSCLFGIEMRF